MRQPCSHPQLGVALCCLYLHSVFHLIHTPHCTGAHRTRVLACSYSAVQTLLIILPSVRSVCLPDIRELPQSGPFLRRGSLHRYRPWICNRPDSIWRLIFAIRRSVNLPRLPTPDDVAIRNVDHLGTGAGVFLGILTRLLYLSLPFQPSPILVERLLH